MVAADRVQNALRALNFVLVVARRMAYDGASHKSIGDVLDVVEYLPRLLADQEDRTNAFRECLRDLAAQWPAFGSAVQYFDGPSASWPW